MKDRYPLDDRSPLPRDRDLRAAILYDDEQRLARALPTVESIDQQVLCLADEDDLLTHVRLGALPRDWVVVDLRATRAQPDGVALVDELRRLRPDSAIILVQVQPRGDERSGGFTTAVFGYAPTPVRLGEFEFDSLDDGLDDVFEL